MVSSKKTGPELGHLSAADAANPVHAGIEGPVPDARVLEHPEGAEQQSDAFEATRPADGPRPFQPLPSLAPANLAETLERIDLNQPDSLNQIFQGRDFDISALQKRSDLDALEAVVRNAHDDYASKRPAWKRTANLLFNRGGSAEGILSDALNAISVARSKQNDAAGAINHELSRHQPDWFHIQGLMALGIPARDQGPAR